MDLPLKLSPGDPLANPVPIPGGTRSGSGKGATTGLIDNAVGLQSQGPRKRFCPLFCLFLGADEKNRGAPSNFAGVVAFRNCCHQPLAAVFQLQSNGQFSLLRLAIPAHSDSAAGGLTRLYRHGISAVGTVEATRHERRAAVFPRGRRPGRFFRTRSEQSLHRATSLCRRLVTAGHSGASACFANCLATIANSENLITTL